MLEKKLFSHEDSFGTKKLLVVVEEKFVDVVKKLKEPLPRNDSFDHLNVLISKDLYDDSTSVHL